MNSGPARTLRVIAVGDLREGTNAHSLAKGFAEHGADLRLVDTSPTVQPTPGGRMWWSIHLNGRTPMDDAQRLGSRIEQVCAGWRPDLLVGLKPIFYPFEIFRRSNAARSISISFDDVSNPDNVTKTYLRDEREWDSIWTTKRHNLSELSARGVIDPQFLWGAYEPAYARNTTPHAARQFDIGFIGAARPDRRNLPEQMAKHLPHRGVLYGPRWRRGRLRAPAAVTMHPAVTRADYTRAANSFRAGLVLLNSDNRDTHTNRSFEAAACGQLVIAKRTLEHSLLYEEGREALFFDTLPEAFELARLTLSNKARAQAMAEAGRRRIEADGHTYADRAKQIIQWMQSN